MYKVLHLCMYEGLWANIVVLFHYSLEWKKRVELSSSSLWHHESTTDTV